MIKFRYCEGSVMGKVFCIMGKSGSGKDTIFKEIIKDNSLNLKK